MFDHLVDRAADAVEIVLLRAQRLEDWLKRQTPATAQWVRASAFAAKPGAVCLVPDPAGGLARVLIGVVLFAGAYMAEVIRGGLQAIPRGQYEAARALGLGYWKMMAFVILPQALKLVIPGMVNSFIALFKDTSLVSIVALFDLLGQLQAAFSDPNWSTPTTLFTGFAFTGLIYFVFCFGMSRYSLFVERRLNAYQRN